MMRRNITVELTPHFYGSVRLADAVIQAKSYELRARWAQGDASRLSSQIGALIKDSLQNQRCKTVRKEKEAFSKRHAARLVIQDSTVDRLSARPFWRLLPSRSWLVCLTKYEAWSL